MEHVFAAFASPDVRSAFGWFAQHYPRAGR